MNNIIKEVGAWIIVIGVMLVLCVGCACIYKLSTGSEFIDTDYITAKEGEVSSQFTADEMGAVMLKKCSGKIDTLIGVTVNNNKEVFGTTLCGSYSDIKKRFRAEYEEQHLKNAITSCERFKNKKDDAVELFGKEYQSRTFWRFDDHKTGKRVNIHDCEIEYYEPSTTLEEAQSRKFKIIKKSPDITMSLFVAPECEYRRKETSDVIEHMACAGKLSVKIGGEDCKITYKCDSDLALLVGAKDE